MSAARLAVVALAAAALAVPATASAERWVSYSVTVEGEGTYVYDSSSADSTTHHDAHWTWRTELPGLTFQGERPVPETGGTPITSAMLLSANSTWVGRGGSGQCTPVAVSDVFPGRFLEDDGIPTPEPTIGLRVLGGIFLDFDWCPDWAATGFDVQGALVDGRHTFDTWFHIPREAIGMGRIIQLVHEEVADRRCPWNLWGGASCRLVYDATVTFDKTNDFELPDGPPPEITPDDIPTPPSPPTPAPVGPDAVVVRAAAAKLPASAASAALVISCPGACTGTVTATLPGSRGASAAKAGVLARRRFELPAGRSHRIVVRFSRAARKRIRRAGAVWLRVRTVAGGKIDDRTLNLPLKGGAKGGPRPLTSGRG